MSLPDDKEFKFSRLGFRRKSNQVNLLILTLFLLASLVCVISLCSFQDIQDTLQDELDALSDYEAIPAVEDDGVGGTRQAISRWRALALAVGILNVLVAILIALRLITIGLRSVALEVWIRRMGAGDLDYRVEMKEQDEITELAIALEELTRRSKKALQLNLVEKLSKGLHGEERRAGTGLGRA